MGEVLVDGCIMDSLPTTVMRALRHGPVVGIDVSMNLAVAAKDLATEGRSRLSLLRGGDCWLPPLARILISCAAMGGCAQLSASRTAADVLIEPIVTGINLLSFKAFDKAVEAGYQAAIDAIPNLQAFRTVESPVVSAAA